MMLPFSYRLRLEIYVTIELNVHTKSVEGR